MTDKDFVQIYKDGLTIGVDFGSINDFAVETIVSYQNGVVNIVSSNIIGRAKDFETQEKRSEYLKRYRA